MNDVFILQFHKFKFQVINCLLATNFRDRPYVDINLKKNTSDSQLEYAAMYILEYNIFFHVKLPVLDLVYRFNEVWRCEGTQTFSLFTNWCMYVLFYFNK